MAADPRRHLRPQQYAVRLVCTQRGCGLVLDVVAIAVFIPGPPR
jgi:hypothetical protein